MRSSTFLRIASIITLLYFAGHTSGVPWTPDADAGPVAVLEAMKSHSFEIMGSTRTYWDFYLGFGIIISLYLLMQAVVLWQLGSLSKTDALRVRPIVASFFVAFFANTILAWKYFFAIPLVMSAVILVCLALAIVTAGRTNAQQGSPADRP